MAGFAVRPRTWKTGLMENGLKKRKLLARAGEELSNAYKLKL